MIVAGLVVSILIIICYFYSTSNEGWLAKSRDLDLDSRSTSDFIQNRSNPITEERVNSRGKNLRTNSGISADESVDLVTKAAYSVVESIRIDEVSRSKLIRTEEFVDRVSYTYEITRKEDLEQFIEKIYSDTADQFKISRTALKALAEEKVSEFEIPSDSVQIVKIKVPLDPSKEITYTSRASRIGSPKEQLDLRNLIVGKVPLTSSGWRYDKLIDTDSD